MNTESELPLQVTSEQAHGVVVAVEPLAAQAGAQVLAAGGNAVDACLAAAFAQGIVNPMACGIAGSFHGLILAPDGSIVVVDAGGCAPKAAHETLWIPAGNWMTQFRVVGEENRWGHTASTVPGFIRGAALSHERYGSGAISWSDLIAPARRLATDGFTVSPFLYKEWMPNQYANGFLGEGPRTLGYTPAGARIYLHDDGTVLRIGERLVQHDYGETLARIADEGPDEFYEGRTAQMMVDDFAENGGLITHDDLREYRPVISEPVVGSFRDRTLVCEGYPTLGPTFLEMMNIIEGWDLESLEWNSPHYLDLLATAMHLAFRDRAEHIGDPDWIEIPSKLTSKEYADELRQQIDLRIQRKSPGRGSKNGASVFAHTTHATVVCFDGSAASITHSIGSGSGAVTPGLGFMHNNHMIMFDPRPGHPNSIGPGKRPNNGGDPLFVLRDGELELAIGSPAGGRKATAIAQILLSMAVYGKGIQAAIDSDRIHSEDEANTLILEPNFPSALAAALAERGYSIDIDPYTARVVGVARDRVNGALSPGVDPRCAAGFALG